MYDVTVALLPDIQNRNTFYQMAIKDHSRLTQMYP